MRKHNAYPTKTSLNLMIRERREGSLRLLILLALVGAILVAIFCRYAVIGQLLRASRAEAAADQAEQQLLQAQTELEAYDEVEAEYSRYFSDALFTDDIPVEYMEALDLMEEELMGKATVSSYNFAGNALMLQLNVSRLSVTSELIEALYRAPMVDSVSISTATDALRTSITGEPQVQTGESVVIMTIILQEVEEG